VLWILYALSATCLAQPNDAGPFSLEEALQSALADHPAMHRAEANYQAGLARRDRTAGGLGPQINLETVVKGGVQGAPNFRLPGLANAGFVESAGGDIVVTQAFDFGRTSSLVKAHGREAEADRQEALSQRLRVLLEVYRAFGQVSLQRELLELALEDAVSRDTLLRSARAHFQTGQVSRVDQGLAGANQAQAQAEVVLRQKQVEQALARLWSAMGRPGRPEREPLPVVWTPPDLQGTLEDDLVSASRHRPELLRASAFLEAAQAELAAAERGNNPTLQLYASGGYVSNLRTGTDPATYAAGISLSVPLYTSGATRAEVTRARGRVEAARARLNEVELDITYQVTQARLALDGLLASIPARNEETAYAEDARRLSELRYEHGIADIIEVQEALSIWLRAREARARLNYDLWAAEAVWRYARGDWVEEAVFNSNGRGKPLNAMHM
jgi:outer membrane protein